MNQANINRRRKRNKRQEQIHKKVIRCSLLQRPVWEHEICPKFLSETQEEENCKHCKYSF